MRSPFNTDCDIFSGPGADPPNQFMGTFLCRLVFQDGIQDYLFGGVAPVLPYWLTIQEYIPVGSFCYPQYSLDTDGADRVAVPSGTVPRFAVLYTDFIIWKDQPEYYRAYLMRLPLPSLFRGGVLLGGAAAVYPPGTTPASGGVLLGGSAMVNFSFPGGVLLGGAAAVYPPGTTPASGGVLLGGAAAVYPPGTTPASGGVLLGGAAAVYPPGTTPASGGVLLGGSAIVIPTFIPMFDGGVLLGGSASVNMHASDSGGVLLGGVAVVSFTPGITTYWQDNFVDTDNTLLTAHAPIVGSGGYSNVSGTSQILSNKCCPKTQSAMMTEFTYDPGHTAYTFVCDFLVVNDTNVKETWFYFRYLNTTNYFYVKVRWPGGGSHVCPSYEVKKVVGGTTTLLGTGMGNLNDNTSYTCRIVLTSAGVAVTINAVVVNVTDSALNTNTKCGLRQVTAIPGVSTPWIDNLLITS